MLISLYNEKFNKWVIRDYDSLSQEELKSYERFKKNITGILNKENVPREIDNTLDEVNNFQQQLRKFRPVTIEDYVSRETNNLETSVMPFTDAFYEAVKTNPVYMSVAMQIRQGSSPYEVIEALLKDRQTLAECIGKLTIQLGEAEMKLLKLQHGNKAVSE